MPVSASHAYGSFTSPKVRISISGDCNLSCFYCKPLGHDSFKTGVRWSLMPSDVSRFVKALAEKGITNFELSGSEPLLRKDAPSFVKSICSAKATKDLTLKTNGTFVKNYADGLRKAGLKKLEISLSSLNFMKYQKITGRDNLYRVLDGLEKAERLKFNDLALNILVLNGINTDELIDFAMLTKTRPVHVRFIEYLPLEAGPVGVQNKLFLSILQIKRTIDGFQKLFPFEDDFESNSSLRFKFRDSLGCISFTNQSDIVKSRLTPTLTLNSTGDLSNSAQPGKSINIMRELRKDSAEVLSKIIDKQLSLIFGKRKTAPSSKQKHAIKKGRAKEARA